MILNLPLDRPSPFRAHNDLCQQQWVGKKYVRITESLDVIEDDLSNYSEKEKEGIRKINRDKELGLTCDERRNFYHM